MIVNALDREVAVYQGDELLAEGKIRDVAKRLNVKPGTIRFYLTPAYERRLAKRKSIDKARTAVRLDGDDDDA